MRLVTPRACNNWKLSKNDLVFNKKGSKLIESALYFVEWFWAAPELFAVTKMTESLGLGRYLRFIVEVEAFPLVVSCSKQLSAQLENVKELGVPEGWGYLSMLGQTSISIGLAHLIHLAS